ncbi:magnesium transporter [Halobacillus massiliensis]|uniref:magnesium transporter n=1 Tax=Halobacillus massiliensis TaxID=1926286 RepID=UPI0009E226BE|nr:magnesium transporter [Halobacillus massiliensis]
MSNTMTEHETTLTMIRLLSKREKQHFQNLVDELQPYDLAYHYVSLPEDLQDPFRLYLREDQAAALMRELDQDEQLHFIQNLGLEKSSAVLNLMENDDVASLLDNLEVDELENILSKMNNEESEAVQHLMNYPPETAGRIMNNRYVWIPETYTVREAVDKLKDFANLAEYLNYLYVIDEEKRLAGVVSYRDLLLREMSDKIEDIMNKRVITTDVLTDQEEVAQMIRKYDFVSLPVVENNQKLVGIITVDDILEVMHREANEDIEKLSASGKAIDFKTKPHIAAARRLPWLVLLLFIGLISGSIISRFEETLESVVALAFFMPMIAGMTGNTGTQSLAVVVRGLINEEVDLKQALQLILRELWVGIMIGVICGILISLIAYIWRDNIMLGFVVGTSLCITLIIGTIAGTVIPLILDKLKVDPAVASGPLITTLNDIISLFIYFGLASVFISRLM